MAAAEVLTLPRAPDAGRRAALHLLIVAWGAQAIVTQASLLREALVLLSGSEIAWGLVLCAWLLGVAVGAAGGGALADRAARRRCADGLLVGVLLLLGAAACADLWLFRGARGWLGFGPGEFLPLPQVALAAVVLVSPTSLLIGMAFPLACAVRTADGTPLLGFGRVYALESVGSLAGGAVFTFWAVERLAPIETALGCAAITAASGAALLGARASAAGRRPGPVGGQRATGPASGRPAQRGGALLAGAAALAALGVLLAAGDALDRRLVGRRWRGIAPGYELVAAVESKYQNLALGRRAGQYTLYCDGQVSAAFPDPYALAPLAHFWLCQHPEPRRVLVLGGGAEGLLAEVLLHPVEEVDYLEPDPRQLALAGPYLAARDAAALADPRVHVQHVDPRYHVKVQRGRYDLVLARLAEPLSVLRARLYTAEFFGELRRAMSGRAVLCLTAAAAPAELPAASRRYLAGLRATLARHFPHVVVGWGDPAQVLAETEPGLLATEPVVLAERYARRKVASEVFDPAWFAGATDWLDADKLARRAAELGGAAEAVVSTDLRPIICAHRLALWEATAGGARRIGRAVIERLLALRLTWLVAGLAAAGGLLLAVGRLRGGPRAGWARGAVTLSVAATGLVTMALSIVWLFAFQNLYGYVYQRIGWIIALYMAGLVGGCVLASRGEGAAPGAAAGAAPGARRRDEEPPAGQCGAADALTRAWCWLIAVDVGLAGLALAAPLVLRALGAWPGGPAALLGVEVAISVLVVLTGVLGGAAFPLAGRLQLALRRGAGAAAGSVVGADHAGAAAGALLAGVVLVPVFGIAATGLLLGAIKLGSAALLVLMPAAWRPAAWGRAGGA